MQAKEEMRLIRQTLQTQNEILVGIKDKMSLSEIKTEGVSVIAAERHLEKDDTRATNVQPRSNENRDFEPAFKEYETRHMSNEHGPGEHETGSKLSPTNEGGLRGLILTDCVRLLNRQQFDVQRQIEHAESLKEIVEYGAELAKDKHDNAMYAFTIVTVIFLPLSTISSIFGMNSKDVRETDTGQWLYWLVALPVTALTVFFGLWWMGQLHSEAEWVLDMVEKWTSSRCWGWILSLGKKLWKGAEYVRGLPTAISKRISEEAGGRPGEEDPERGTAEESPSSSGTRRANAVRQPAESADENAPQPSWEG